MARSAVTKSRLGKVGAEVGIEGVEEIKAELAARVNRLSGRLAKKVFMRAAMRLVEEAKDLAPVETGALRDAIYAAYGDPAKPNVIVGVNYRKAPHAHLIEYGHVQWRGGIRKKGSGHEVAAPVKPHPYMRPALAATRPKMAAIIAEGLRDLVAQLKEAEK